MFKLNQNMIFSITTYPFARLSVAETANSDHPCIGRKTILFRIRLEDCNSGQIYMETQ